MRHALSVNVWRFAPLLLWSLAHAALAADINPEWSPLFDGKGLDGWYIVLSGHEHDQDPDHLVQVHDKMIHVYKDAPDKRPV